MIINLEQAKKHLNIEHNLDDEYIDELIDMADELIFMDLNRTGMTESILGTAYPKVLIHAAKILVATFYENRESVTIGVSAKETPFSYKYLISTYKKYAVR